MEFGIVVFTYDSIANAAREGARYGIIHPSETGNIEAAARRSTSGLHQEALQVRITRPTSDTIQVAVDYYHDLITAPIIQSVGGNPAVHLRTVSTMRIE